MGLRKTIRGRDLYGDGWSATIAEATITINAAGPDLYIYVERTEQGRDLRASLHTVSHARLRRGAYPLATDGVCIVLHLDPASRREDGRPRAIRYVLYADVAPREAFTGASEAANVPAI